MPFRTDNALVKAAEVVGRLAALDTHTSLDDVWRRFVADYDLPPDLARKLGDAKHLAEYLRDEKDVGLAREIHAVTRTTFAPTIAHGGVKTNVIPDTVEVQMDIRTVPGDTAEQVQGMIVEALGPLAGRSRSCPGRRPLERSSPVDRCGPACSGSADGWFPAPASCR